MIFIRKFDVLQLRVMFFATAIMFLLMWPFHSVASDGVVRVSETQPAVKQMLNDPHSRDADAESAKPDCLKPKLTPASPLFKNLKGINLYIDVPARFQEALDCHGHEEKCAASFSDTDKYAKQLADDYNIWPVLLRPENLTNLFLKQIQKNFLAVVQPDEKCKLPEVNILNKKNLFAAVYQENTLTITVKLTFDGLETPYSRPQVAVLAVHSFRPDSNTSNYDTQVGVSSVMPFPLNMSEKEISQRLVYFVPHAHMGGVAMETDNSIR